MRAPTPALIAELGSLALGVPIGTEVSDWASLPAIRVTKTGDHESPSSWETTPLYQVEVWAATEAEAEDLAWLICDRWPVDRARTIEVAGEPWALCTSTWVEVTPYPLTPPDGTDYARYVLSLGIRLHGADQQ